MGYTKGQKVTLKKVASYPSSTGSAKGTVTGTFYLWSAATAHGRIRIAKSKSNCGKSPESKYVVCWINTTAIKSGKNNSSKNGKDKASKTKKKKKTTGSVTTNIVEASNVTPTGTEPGQIGYLGKVLFIVKADQDGKIITLDNFSLACSANYAEHGRHLKTPTVEFTGVNAQKVQFDITLSQYLGTEPMESHNKLKGYMEKGVAVPLKLGSVKYGNYRWCITNLSFKGEATDKDGNWTQATESVTLISVEKKG